MDDEPDPPDVDTVSAFREAFLTTDELAILLQAEIDELQADVERLEGELSDAKADAKAKQSAQAPTKSPPPKQANKQAQGTTYEATYYSAYCPTCGEWGGVTAMGDDISNSIYVGGKRVIAVDPNVIALGTRVKVTTPYETFEAVSRDTGGSIKGNRIDILVESTEKAYELGRHNVTVEILK